MRINKMYKKILTLIAAATTAFHVSAQQVSPFKSGDRVVFVGNSITDGGHYHSYIWLYYMTHFPDRRITCLNAGIGGDVVKQIYDRFDTDVFSKKPTVLTLTWGMNDTGYFEWYRQDAKDTVDRKLQQSFKYYKMLEAKLKQRPDIRKVIIGGSPYDETTKFTTNNYYPHKSEALAQVVEFQHDAANKNGWPFVDFFHPMQQINQTRQQKDSTFSLTPNDRIHPDNDGHMVMAYLFLKAQGLSNKPVAAFQINAKSKKVLKSENCLISAVTPTATGVRFNYLAHSLPYPLDTIPRGWENRKPQSDALKIVPFTKEFNQELVQVTGLENKDYNLLIDGQRVGTYTGRQLAAGVNLADNIRTPQYQQAVQIRELNEERWEIEKRFRNYAWMEYDFLKGKGMLFKDDAAAMDLVNEASAKEPFVRGNRDTYAKARFKSVRDVWQMEIDALTNQIYAINKPLAHIITVAQTN
jgi:lysophospholipase L1-like esterase